MVKADAGALAKGNGFIEILEKRWDEQYPEKTFVSNQNIRDNALRLKDEMNKELGDEAPAYIEEK